MKALVFDLDDTLYDQIQPFERALKRHLSVPEEQLVHLYLAFRHYADQVFEAAATGKVSLKDSHVYRMKAALADFGYQVSDGLALTIQIDYDYYQGQLELSPIYPAIFEACKQRDITLGIITNGPHRHQLRKIRTLGLQDWIEQEKMVISGQVGMTKPNPAIFKLTEERLGMAGQEICYVGDSFENDIIGAKSAGWQAIWFNHRKRQQPETSVEPDKVVTEWLDLETAIIEMGN
ncbi:HAD family hydrolase [Streptococcus suis]|nr:HAD family hydrolase [Streptococcus suis]